MKPIHLLTILLAGLAFPLHAANILDEGHTDIGINYEGGAWDLHIHDEENDVEYEPDEAILQVNAEAETVISSDPDFAFMGSAGNPVWILPQNAEVEGLLFLGFGAEELASGIFVSDEISLTLTSYSGTGDFFLYQEDAFGDPTVFMNTADGLSSGDTITAIAGGHTHYYFAFTNPGTYELTFTASGELTGGGTTSDFATYTVEVVPEPSTWMMLFLGLGIVLLLARKHSQSLPL